MGYCEFCGEYCKLHYAEDETGYWVKVCAYCKARLDEGKEAKKGDK